MTIEYNEAAREHSLKTDMGVLRGDYRALRAFRQLLKMPVWALWADPSEGWIEVIPDDDLPQADGNETLLGSGLTYEQALKARRQIKARWWG